ncbi:Hsp20/alpha crystallin family protein [bacterium]|nr:Hsp20/alpha crystallin family protein [bacterium]
MRLIEPNTGLALREAVSRLVEDNFVRPDRTPSMPVDVMEVADSLIVKAALPGATKDKLQIQLEQNILTLKAEFAEEQLPENGRWLLRERNLTAISRTFRMPFPIDAEQARAEFQDGILTLTLPKLESAKPRQITIQ